ncbi:4Fe-4S dicluster domain-containing protein [Sulfurisphaera javensis]|uniref:4Fe-4S dicluster domain-containing protein n=1 Tax=Sulfurisphaera javensis TaxID=2049879 RepID=A0AAT9GPT1_9CREN
MLNLLYSQLSLTRKSSILPDRVVTVKSEEDLKNISEGVGRYEYTRGIEGKIIVDLTNLKGIERKDDKLRVLAGTHWREVISYNPEIFGNLDFSVAGSIEYSDAGFGFNEFRFIKDRAEVEAYLNGNKYVGKYKGGIIYAVLIRQESKELVTKSFESNDFDVIYYKIKSWFATSYPAFRDITVAWNNGKFVLNVTYTKVREELLKNFISDFPEGQILYEDLNFPHKYRYFGVVSFDDLYKIKDQILKSTRAFLRIGFKNIYFSIYSNTFLNFPGIELNNFSDINETNLLNGCIMCGKCVEVCPYSEYKGSPVYSPLGFYVLQALGSSIQINCHMCGKCVEVCPANLDILSDISKTATYEVKTTSDSLNIKELNSNRVIVITPISLDLKERLVKALLYLYSKGSIVGIKYLDININDLIKNKIDWKSISTKFTGITQIITLTPEEYYYLQPLKQYLVLDISYIEDYVLPEIEIDYKKLHIPCYLKDLEKKIKPSKCSFAFLDILNNTSVPNNIKDEITLCPLTARKLNIKTPLDLLIPTINLGIINQTVNKIKEKLKDSSQLLDDAIWYSGIADDLYSQISDNLYTYALQEVPKEELLLLYLYLDNVDLNQQDKKNLEQKIPQLLIK